MAAHVGHRSRRHGDHHRVQGRQLLAGRPRPEEDARVTVLETLPPMDIASRASRLREVLDVDALLVTKLVNIRYLTGFTGSAAMLLVLPTELVFVTDGRYRDQSAEQLAATGV